MRVFLMIATACLTMPGCIRGGYGLDEDGGNGGTTDRSSNRPDLRQVGLGQKCGPPACKSPLVCTGVTGKLTCHKPCGTPKEHCPAGTICGWPLVGGKVEQTRPRTCVKADPKGAHKYQGCYGITCIPPLGCVNSETYAICQTACSTDTQCDPKAKENCIQINKTTGAKSCLSRCTSDKDCFPPAQCAGFGPAPHDRCVAAPTVNLGEDCNVEGKVCPAGRRCLGIAPRAMCYPLCQNNTCSDPKKICMVLGSLQVPYCVRSCDPAGEPTEKKCSATETCVTENKTLKAYCYPIKSYPDTCTKGPCDSGKICVGGKCAQACSTKYPCPGLLACTGLSSGGKTLPWKACVAP